MQDSLLELAPLLDDLLPSALSKQLEEMANRTVFTHGQLIQTRGDTKSGLSIVRTGAVKVGNQGRDGSYLTTSVMGPGQCFGEFTLLAGLPRTHEIVAIGKTEIDEINKRRFLTLFDAEPELAKALLKISLVRNHSLLEFMDDMRRLPLIVHVAKFVYRSAGNKTEIKIRQEDLAFTFGVSRVSMGKVLKRLVSLNLLRLGYGKIELTSRQSLRDWLEQQSLIKPLAVPSLHN